MFDKDPQLCRLQLKASQWVLVPGWFILEIWPKVKKMFRTVEKSLPISTRVGQSCKGPYAQVLHSTRSTSDSLTSYELGPDSRLSTHHRLSVADMRPQEMDPCDPSLPWFHDIVVASL